MWWNVRSTSKSPSTNGLAILNRMRGCIAARTALKVSLSIGTHSRSEERRVALPIYVVECEIDIQITVHQRTRNLEPNARVYCGENCVESVLVDRDTLQIGRASCGSSDLCGGM